MRQEICVRAEARANAEDVDGAFMPRTGLVEVESEAGVAPR